MGENCLCPMTLDPGDNPVKLCTVPMHQTVCEILRFKGILENGRFHLENVGQGQLIIHHFSQKNKPNKVAKKYQRLSE